MGARVKAETLLKRRFSFIPAYQSWFEDGQDEWCTYIWSKETEWQSYKSDMSRQNSGGIFRKVAMMLADRNLGSDTHLSKQKCPTTTTIVVWSLRLCTPQYCLIKAYQSSKSFIWQQSFPSPCFPLLTISQDSYHPEQLLSTLSKQQRIETISLFWPDLPEVLCWVKQTTEEP